MTTAEFIVKALEEEGVKYIFGVPGEENEDILFAISNSTIQFVNCRHEQGAGFMANVYGRLTGRPGVCLSTLGPGATNLLTALADAHLDKSPVVALTAQGGLDRVHHESHQLIDIVQMFRPISKYSATITTSSIAGEVIRKAFKWAQLEKPGVCHVELPESIADQKVDNAKVLPASMPRLPAPDPTSLGYAIDAMNRCHKPIILAGNGAIRNRASAALQRLASDKNIPVASTFMGKGSISDRSPQSLRAVGLGFKDYVLKAFEEADLVITIGYDIAEYDPKMWNIGTPKEIIHIDFSAAEIYQEYHPNIEIIGDIQPAIDKLYLGMETSSFPDWYRDIQKRITDDINSYQAEGADTSFTVPSCIGVVNQLMTDKSLVISDVGAHKMWIARNLMAPAAQTCIISNGLATMGIALPGSIGAYYADPSRHILSMMGDGGFMMNVQDLETAVRNKVSACYLIFVNNDYELISWKQERHRGKSFGTTFGNPDFQTLAKAFGIKSYHPANHQELGDAITDTWADREIALIAVPVEGHVNAELVDKLKKYWKS